MHAQHSSTVTSSATTSFSLKPPRPRRRSTNPSRGENLLPTNLEFTTADTKALERRHAASTCVREHERYPASTHPTAVRQRALAQVSAPKQRRQRADPPVHSAACWTTHARRPLNRPPTSATKFAHRGEIVSRVLSSETVRRSSTCQPFPMSSPRSAIKAYEIALNIARCSLRRVRSRAQSPRRHWSILKRAASRIASQLGGPCTSRVDFLHKLVEQVSKLEVVWTSGCARRDPVGDGRGLTCGSLITIANA